MKQWYEPYGTEVVPEQERQGGFLAPFLIMVNYFINPGTIITAAMGVAGGLSVPIVILVQLTGVMLGILVFLVMARIGVDYGLTGQMACRAALGIRGGKWLTSPLRVCCSVYWFAFQTQAGSLALLAVLQQAFAVNPPFWLIAFVFAGLQVLVSVLGYRLLQGLFFWAFPLKIVCLLILVLAVFNPQSAVTATAFSLPENTGQWLLIMTWFNAIFGGMLTMVTDAADFTRYTRTREALWQGGLCGAVLGVFIAAGFGAGIMAVLGGTVDELFSRLLLNAPGLLTVLALLLLMVMDNWTINVINLYSGGISLSHTFETLGRGRCTILVSVLAVGLSCCSGVVSSYLFLAEQAGILFASITGVLLMDFIGRKWLLEVPALYQKGNCYWYQQGFNVRAWGIIVLATGLGYQMPAHWPAPVLVIITGAVLYRLWAGRFIANS